MGRLLSSRRGRVTPSSRARPLGKGLCRGLPIILVESGFGSGHFTAWPRCPRTCQAQSHLQTSAQSHTASDITRISFQLSPAPKPRHLENCKGFEGPSSPLQAGQPAAHRQVAAASRATSTRSPPKEPSLACFWLRSTFNVSQGLEMYHRAEKDWVTFLLPRSANLGSATRSLAALLLLPTVWRAQGVHPPFQGCEVRGWGTQLGRNMGSSL